MPSLVAARLGSVLAGRYELVRLLARGGMADVYEARDRQLRRSVAVKLIRGAASGGRARFDAEVRVLAALNHPGLVQVYDAGELDGDGFVVLELIEGPTLAERGAIPPAEVAGLGSQIADALAYVHERGVVHRDVTPSNILCGSDGRPRLADFGIARLVGTTRVTSTAMTVGTAAYMAPEQVQGRDATPAADVYSLGLVLLELLTGRKAFEGAPHEVALARLARRPDTVTGVPDSWQPLLGALTERAAENRPTAATAAARLRALAQTTAGEASYATTDSLPAATSTTPMPATLAPDATAAEPWAATVVAFLARHKIMVLVAALGLIVLWGVASAGRGMPVDPPATTPTTEVVVTDPTTTTTVPTTTSMPEEHEGNRGGEGGPGKGKDKGKGARD